MVSTVALTDTEITLVASVSEAPFTLMSVESVDGFTSVTKVGTAAVNVKVVTLLQAGTWVTEAGTLTGYVVTPGSTKMFVGSCV